MTEKSERTISFEVKEHIGIVATYSSGWSKELNLIAWNGAAPKYDIRDWDETHTHMSKGVTLFEGEMQTLMDIYVQAKNRRIFEEAKKQREARAREIEEGRKAYAQRKAALDRAIAARDESVSAGESLNKSEGEGANESIAEGADEIKEEPADAAWVADAADAQEGETSMNLPAEGENDAASPDADVNCQEGDAACPGSDAASPDGEEF